MATPPPSDGTGHAGKRRWRTLSHRGPLFPSPEGPAATVRCSGLGLKVPHEAAVAVRRMREALTRRKFSTAERDALETRFWQSWSAQYAPNCTRPTQHEVVALVATATRGKLKTQKRDEPSTEGGYETACVDGRLRSIANYRMEAPGVFTGRGLDHPSAGKVRRVVRSSDVTINIGKGARVRPPSDGGKWGKVVHDDEASWLASWRDPATGKTKYMRLAEHAEEDLSKFEVARQVARALPAVRRDAVTRLGALLRTSLTPDRLVDIQTLCCFLLIDRFALRVGGDRKGRVFGATTLRTKHVKIFPPSKLSLSFVGKDSVGCVADGHVASPLYAGIGLLRGRHRGAEHDIFDLIDDRDLNSFVHNRFAAPCLDDVTAKTVRTSHACTLYESVLVLGAVTARTETCATKGQPSCHDGDGWRWRLLERIAVARVALLCNHRKGAGANSHTQEREQYEIDAVGKMIFDSKSGSQSSVRDAFRSATAGLNLSTAPANYIDPRITRAYEARHGLEEGTCSSVSLRKKFLWAARTPAGFRFIPSARSSV